MIKLRQFEKVLSDKCRALNPFYPGKMSADEYTNHQVMWLESLVEFSYECWVTFDNVDDPSSDGEIFFPPAKHMEWYFRSPPPKQEIEHKEFKMFLNPMPPLMIKARKEVGDWFLKYAYGRLECLPGAYASELANEESNLIGRPIL